MPFILANAWLASALMEFPNLCLPYMANDAALPSPAWYAGAYDASVMGRKRTLRVRKWHHSGGRGPGHAAARWGGWRIPEMNRISTFRAAVVALSMVAFGGAALAQLPAPSASPAASPSAVPSPVPVPPPAETKSPADA